MPSVIDTFQSAKLLVPKREVPARTSEPTEPAAFEQELDRAHSKPRPSTGRSEEAHAKNCDRTCDAPLEQASDCTEVPTESQEMAGHPEIAEVQPDSPETTEDVPGNDFDKPVAELVADLYVSTAASTAVAPPLASTPVAVESEPLNQSEFVESVDDAIETTDSVATNTAARSTSVDLAARGSSTQLPEGSPQIVDESSLDATASSVARLESTSPLEIDAGATDDLPAQPSEHTKPQAVAKQVSESKGTPEESDPQLNVPERSASKPDTVAPVVRTIDSPSIASHGTASVAPELNRIEAPSIPQEQPIRGGMDFATDNHESIITGIRTQLLPSGGNMRLRLDPPELGALQVMVSIRDGVVTASFQTSSDDATRLLSHSLSQLKNSLEAQGISIDKLHVQQAPRDQQSTNDEGAHQHQQSWQDGHSARQEQQRRDLLQRMWRRLTEGSDPLDMFA